MLLMLCATVFAGEADKVDFFIKVKSGNPNVIEKLYIIKFGDAFHYGIDNKVFTANSTNAEKIAFIDSLKKAGHQIETTDDPNQYFIVVLDNDEQTVLYSIDSSYFKNSPQHIVVLQKILGTAVTGGAKELVKRKKSEIPTLRVALADSGFECTVDGNIITIRERRFVRILQCPEEVKALVINEIKLFTKDIDTSGKNIRITISNSQLQELQKRILVSGLISKINIEKDGIINLLPIQAKKFSVKIMLNNKFEYDKVVVEVKKNKQFNISDHELQENRLGVNIGLFELSAKDMTGSEIRQAVWQSIRSACPRLRIKDINVVEKKGN